MSSEPSRKQKTDISWIFNVKNSQKSKKANKQEQKQTKMKLFSPSVYVNLISHRFRHLFFPTFAKLSLVTWRETPANNSSWRYKVCAGRGGAGSPGEPRHLGGSPEAPKCLLEERRWGTRGPRESSSTVLALMPGTGSIGPSTIVPQGIAFTFVGRQQEVLLPSKKTTLREGFSHDLSPLQWKSPAGMFPPTQTYTSPISSRLKYDDQGKRLPICQHPRPRARR